MLGVSFDTVAKNRAFAEKFDFPFALLCDTDRALGLAYQACKKATDTSASRITYVVGPGGTIERAIDTKDPGGQADVILAALP